LKILIVDDHPVFLKGLAMVLSSTFCDAKIEEETCGKTAITRILYNSYDLILLDFRLKDITGLEILNTTKSQVRSKFIMLTMYDDEEIAKEVINAGIDGYILKENAVFEIITAIETVFRDKKYIDRFFDGSILHNDDNVIQHLSGLTSQEKKIIKLISQSLSSKQIAENLAVSVNTIENHRTNISTKLNIKGNKSLLSFAIENRSLIHTL